MPTSSRAALAASSNVRNSATVSSSEATRAASSSDVASFESPLVVGTESGDVSEVGGSSYAIVSTGSVGVFPSAAELVLHTTATRSAVTAKPTGSVVARRDREVERENLVMVTRVLGACASLSGMNGQAT